MYIYFAWGGKDYIDSTMRTTLFTGFGILAGAGCFVFLLLNTNVETLQSSTDTKEDEAQSQQLMKKNTTSAGKTILDSMVQSFQLLATKEMLLMSSLFIYSGFVLSFFSGVYPTAIGNSKSMQDSMATVGLVGVFIGAGEVIGGGMFVFGSKVMERVSRPTLLVWYNNYSLLHHLFLALTSLFKLIFYLLGAAIYLTVDLFKNSFTNHN